MKYLIGSAVVVAAFVLASGVAAQSTGTVTQETCDSDAHEVSGIGNVVRITGYCKTLAVSGTGNKIVVDRAGSIKVNGTGNLVQYIKLNPNPKNPKKPLHPGQSSKGIGNLISWTKGVEPKNIVPESAAGE